MSASAAACHVCCLQPTFNSLPLRPAEETCALEACYVAAFRMKHRGLVMHEKLDKAAVCRQPRGSRMGSQGAAVWEQRGQLMVGVSTHETPHGATA